VADKSSGRRLTDEQVDALVARVKAGEYLDEYLRPLLFRRAKEYELDYAEKAPKSRVLADTMGVPLQPLKRFGAQVGMAACLMPSLLAVATPVGRSSRSQG